MASRGTTQRRRPATKRQQRSVKVQDYLNRQLEKTRRQVKVFDLVAYGLGLVALLLGVLLVLIVVDSWVISLTTTGRWVSLALLFVVTAAYSVYFILPLLIRRVNPQYAAQMIEQSEPGFKNRLLNYLHLRDTKVKTPGAVRDIVARQAAEKLASVPEESTVDRSSLIRTGFLLVGIVTAAVLYTMFSPKSPFPAIGRIFSPAAKISSPSIVQISDVTPGDTDIFFGQPLEVTAMVTGGHDPRDVKIIYSSDDGQLLDQEMQMTATGASSYRARLTTDGAGVQQSLSYRVVARDGTSPDYAVRVRANPTISIQSVLIQPPDYTKLPERTINGQGVVQVIEGTAITVQAVANLPIHVANVELLRLKGQPVRDESDPIRSENEETAFIEAEYMVHRTIEMAVDDEKQATAQFVAGLNASRDRPAFTHFRLSFVSKENDRSENPNVYPVRITPDLAPEVTIIDPARREISIPVNQRLPVQVEASDLDFDISAIDLHVDTQGRNVLDPDMKKTFTDGSQRVRARYFISPQDLGLEVGDKAVFFATALDNRVSVASGAPDPNIARTENYTVHITEAREPTVEEQRRQNPQPDPEQDQQNPETENPNQDQRGGPNEPENQQELNEREQNDDPRGTNDPDEQQDVEQQQKPRNEGDPQQQNDAEQDSAQPDEDQQSSAEQNGESEPGNQGGNEQDSATEQTGSEQGDGQSGSQSGDEAGERGTEQGNAAGSGGTGSESIGENNTDQGQKSQNANGGSRKSNDGGTQPGQTQAGDSPNQDPGTRDENLAAGDMEQLPKDASDGERIRELMEYLEENMDDAQADSEDQRRQQADESESQSEQQDGDQPEQPGEQPGQEGGDQPGQEGGGQPGQEGGEPGQEGGDQPGQEGGEPGQEGGDQPGQEGGEPGQEGGDQPGQEGGEPGQEGGEPGQEGGEPGQEGGDQPGQEGGEPGQEGGDQPGQEGGEPGQEGGDQPGQEGGEPGQEGGDQPGQEGGEPGQEGGDQPGQEGGEPGQEARDQPGQPGEGQPGQGESDSTGQPSDRESNGSSSTEMNGGSTGGAGVSGDSMLPEEQANLEFAEEATDLILKNLNEQKTDPDPELLDRLNYTEKELGEFVDRWNQMKAEAESGDVAAQQRYRDALESLGLVPDSSSAREITTERDNTGGHTQDAARSQPPSQFIDLFNKVKKDLNRNDE